VQPRRDVLESLADKASGLGVVRFDKARQTITIECWPFLADPTKDPQFAGWPVTVSVLDNYGRNPKGLLPAIEVAGDEKPVLQVISEADGDILYTLRIPGRKFQPHVFAPGKYTVRISRPEIGTMKELTGLEPARKNSAVVRVEV
jgi:alkaline phosphatase D